MTDDEKAIRELVSNWISASKAGDVATVLSLIADDAVFLHAGRPLMRKADFAAASSTPSKQAPHFDGTSEIQEIVVHGDWAYMWSQLSVVISPPGGKPIKRAGPTLTILKKVDGRWVLFRDANMLSVVADSV